MYVFVATQLSVRTYNKLNYMILKGDNRIYGTNEPKKVLLLRAISTTSNFFIDRC